MARLGRGHRRRRELDSRERSIITGRRAAFSSSTAGSTARSSGRIRRSECRPRGDFGSADASTWTSTGSTRWATPRLSARDLRDVYVDGPELGTDDHVRIDEDAARLILDALQRGDAALCELAPDQQPVVWLEHFDIGRSLGEVNFGVSPGDASHDEPYADVGPWQSRTGAFWNEPFGASRPMRDLPSAAGVLAFFAQGLEALAHRSLGDT